MWNKRYEPAAKPLLHLLSLPNRRLLPLLNRRLLPLLNRRLLLLPHQNLHRLLHPLRLLLRPIQSPDLSVGVLVAPRSHLCLR